MWSLVVFLALGFQPVAIVADSSFLSVIRHDKAQQTLQQRSDVNNTADLENGNLSSFRKRSLTSSTISRMMSDSNGSDDSDSWQLLKALIIPTTHEEGSFVMVNGKGYALGGRGSNVTVDIYDPRNRTWTRGPPMPMELTHFQPVVVGDRFIYIVTAWTGPFPHEVAVRNVYIFDTLHRQWSMRPGLPAHRNRGSTTAVLFQREIYVSHGNIGGHAVYGTASNWLDKYHVDKNLWTTNLTNAPNARDHTGAVLIRDGTSKNPMFCVAAGRLSSSRYYRDLTVLPTDCYHIRNNTWTVHANITGKGRAGAAYGRTCDGKAMIVAGGEGFGQAWRNVDVFDGTSWTAWPSLKQARQGTGLAVSCTCKNITYLVAGGVGGQGGTPLLNSTEQYRPEDQATCPSAAPSRRPSMAPSQKKERLISAVRVFNVFTQQEVASVQENNNLLVLFLDQVGTNVTLRVDLFGNTSDTSSVSNLRFAWDGGKYTTRDFVAPYWMGGNQSDINVRVPALSKMGNHTLVLQVWGSANRLLESRLISVVVEASFCQGFALMDVSSSPARAVQNLVNGSVVRRSASGRPPLNVGVQINPLASRQAWMRLCVRMALDESWWSMSWRKGDCQAPYQLRTDSFLAPFLPYYQLTTLGSHTVIAAGVSPSGQVMGRCQVTFTVTS